MLEVNEEVVREVKRLTKTDLIAATAEENGDSKKSVKKTIDTFLEKLTEAVAAGDIVTLQNLGRIFSKEAKPRSFRKIHSDEVIEVGFRNLPKIKFSKKFTTRVKAGIQ